MSDNLNCPGEKVEQMWTGVRGRKGLDSASYSLGREINGLVGIKTASDIYNVTFFAYI